MSDFLINFHQQGDKVFASKIVGIQCLQDGIKGKYYLVTESEDISPVLFFTEDGNSDAESELADIVTSALMATKNIFAKANDDIDDSYNENRVSEIFMDALKSRGAMITIDEDGYYIPSISDCTNKFKFFSSSYANELFIVVEGMK